MRVLVLGNQSFADRCQESLQDQPAIKVVGKTSSVQDARDVAKEMEPDVILVEDCFDLDTIGRLVRAAPRSAVIIASPRMSMDLQRRAAEVGVREVLQYPIRPGDLLETMDRVQTTVQHRVAPVDDFEDESAYDIRVEPSGGYMRQEVIVVHSPKGGVGKTTISLNLAVQYRDSLGPEARVLLVDLDPFGNVIGYLKLQGHANLESWSDLPGEPTFAELENELTCLHPETGIRIIPAPKMVYALRAIEPEAIERILSVARKHFDVIIIDLCPMLMDAQIIALEHATRVLEVVIPEVPTMKSLNEFRGLLDRLCDVNQANIGLILNRVPQKLRPPFKSIREIHELYLPPWPLVAVIPESDDVGAAINSFKPAVLEYPNSTFAAEIQKLVGVSTSPAQQKRTPFGWFRGMLRQ